MFLERLTFISRFIRLQYKTPRVNGGKYMYMYFAQGTRGAMVKARPIRHTAVD